MLSLIKKKKFFNKFIKYSEKKFFYLEEIEDLINHLSQRAYSNDDIYRGDVNRIFRDLPSCMYDYVYSNIDVDTPIFTLTTDQSLQKLFRFINNNYLEPKEYFNSIENRDLKENFMIKLINYKFYREAYRLLSHFGYNLHCYPIIYECFNKDDKNHDYDNKYLQKIFKNILIIVSEEQIEGEENVNHQISNKRNIIENCYNKF